MKPLCDARDPDLVLLIPVITLQTLAPFYDDPRTELFCYLRSP